ncbi:MAG: hypothetical protein IKR19_08355 [Acholeplasmatales bacterium]|nr:hypothetical protein [Acholeplasmatales bacterium]
MEMTVEELIENLTTIRNKICSSKYETETSLTFDQTLDIMRKYQKILEIVTKWQNEPQMKFATSYYNMAKILATGYDNMAKITEVMEDGNKDC